MSCSITSSSLVAITTNLLHLRHSTPKNLSSLLLFPLRPLPSFRLLSSLSSSPILDLQIHSEPHLEDRESGATEAAPAPLPKLPSPNLTLKEKKELASFAHGLGKKLKSQQVGKGGVTASVAASFVETLEVNELLKLKIHGNCPEELSTVIEQLEQATGSVAVAQIGRSVILYRPSISKIKKREAQNSRSSWNAKSSGTYTMQKRRQVPANRFR